MDKIAIQSALSTVFGGSAIASPDKFPCFNGSSLGYITPANLASVLGGVYNGTIPQNGDFNDYKTPGKYSVVNYTLAQTLAHRPKTDLGGGCLYVIPANGTRTFIQLYYDTSGNQYSRLINADDMASSSAWIDMSYLKDYTSLSSLASVLGADGYLRTIPSGTTSLASVTTIGTYLIAASDQFPDRPLEGGGVLRVLRYSVDTVTQIFERGNPKEVSIRLVTDIGSSKTGLSWTRLDNFGCDSLSSLASALGGFIYKGTASIADCNDAPLGVCETHTNTLNAPVAATLTLVTFGNPSNHKLQLCMRSLGSMYYRGYSDSWSEWKEVQMV